MKLITEDEFLQSNIELPNRVVLTDNGSYDLENKGFKGKYVWIGYVHSSLRSEPSMNPILHATAKKIAAWLESKYKSKSHIDNFLDTCDMYRVWITEDSHE